MNIFEKIKFLLTKPKVVIVIGQGRKAAEEAIFQVLKQYFKVGKDVFIFETEDKEINRFLFFLKNSKLPILAITGINETSLNCEAITRSEATGSLVKSLPANTYLVLNFDNDAAKEIKSITNAQTLTFGFQEKADIWASDVNSDINEPARIATPARHADASHAGWRSVAGGTNFKINYQGKIVPIWLKNIAGKEQIYASISAVAVGIIFGLNLVEISQALRNYRGIVDKAKL